MAQRNKYPGVTMQPSRPGPYGEPQWAYFGGRPAWMDRRQVGPETTSEVLAGMGGQEDRLGALAGADRVPPQDVTTVIKEYEDDTPNTRTTTIKGGLLGEPAQDWAGRGAERDERGMRDWYAQMAQAQARQQQGTAAPSQEAVEGALERYARMRKSQLTPPSRDREQIAQVDPRIVALNRRGEPVGLPPSMNMDWSKIRASQRPGYIPPVNPYDFVGVPGGGQKVPGKLDLGLPPKFQSAVEEQALTGFPPIQKQIKPEDPSSIATGPTDAMIEERFRRETAMIPDNERFVGGDVPSVSGIGTRVDQQLPREIGGEGDVGRIDVRKRGQQLPREVTESASGFPTGKDSKANDQVEMNNNPNLEKIWGKYAYDPKARRKFYLDNLKDIWRKALLMDVVANLTGGTSMSKRYLEMATGRLEQMEKFNEEERISNIWREVFTDANGNFYMPKTKREAAERAGKTGARPAVIKDIFGSVPDVKKKVQYHRVDPNDPTKWENKRFDPDEEPSEEWITGASRTTSPDTEDIYTSRLNEWERLRGTNPRLAQAYGRMVGAVEKDPKGVSPSRWTSILQGDIQGSDPTIQLPEGETATSFIMKWLTQPEVEYVDPITEETKKMPGYSGLTGQKATKEEIAEATGATTATTPEYASRAEAKSAIIAENPKPEGMSDEVYNRKIEEKVREIYGE